MKKIIIAMLLSSLCVVSGCKDDEVIELYDINASVDDEIVGESAKDSAVNVKDINNIKEQGADNNNQMAGNDENSRPFVVFVTGEVKNPGVYELEEGSRIIDAISCAGGYTDEAYDNNVNLACKIHDEEMIYIPSKEEIEELGDFDENSVNINIQTFLKQGLNNASTNSESNNSNGLVNINKATKDELMTIPGIGEAKAEKIIDYREQNGEFKTPEDVMQISGIKEGMYNKIKDRICVR